MESESRPYLNNEGGEVDFYNKRLQYWLETVPGDIRRLQYEMWLHRREYLNQNKFLYDYYKKNWPARGGKVPSFTDKDSEEYWKEYRASFLHGDERQERFRMIIEQTKESLPKMLESKEIGKNRDKILLVALSGSSVYGPRKQEASLADIDVTFLMDSENSEYNFDIIPKGDKPSSFHLFGTGKTDESRGSQLMHWLLYPHYPLDNRLDDASLRKIINELVNTTRLRLDEIRNGKDRLHDSSPSNENEWKK